MSYMSDCYIEITELVGNAIESGAYYVSDVVDYVNQRSRMKVDREIVQGIIDSIYFDYDGGASQQMLMNMKEV